MVRRVISILDLQPITCSEVGEAVLGMFFFRNVFQEIEIYFKMELLKSCENMRVYSTAYSGPIVEGPALDIGCP